MPYDVSRMREKIKHQMAGKAADPNEFKPPKCSGPELTFRFYILGPLMEGDKCATGTATKSMDLYTVSYGVHWVNNRPHACPRVLSDGEESCPMCDVGFALLSEAKSNGATNEARRLISRQWLSSASPLANIYFPPTKDNPEELQGRVMFFRAPKTCVDQWRACLERDDAGDPEEPEAFGAFFDEESAIPYRLKINKSGDWNDYKASGFMKIAPRPIVAKPDGSPDIKAIADILGRRHDLWIKAGSANLPEIKRLTANLLNNDDEEGGDAGFSEDETKPAARTQTPARSTVAPRSGTSVSARSNSTAARPASTASTASTAVLDDEEEIDAKPLRGGGAATATMARATRPARPAPPAEDDEDIDELLNQLPGDDE